jgi:N-acetyl-gamma-glutamyl-phosphate/LysW-gamma-L-alpha-aminoadipyl-6-phosphate reductase
VTERLRVAVLGASGYVGGELLRLLHGHPLADIAAACSERLAGRRVDGAHPHLRGVVDQRFLAPQDLPDCDALILATPHKLTMRLVPTLLGRAPLLIDLSADFRLSDAAVYERYYGLPHAAPDLLPSFVGGWPELDRKALVGATRISVPGCMATAATLALHPVADLVAETAIVDGRIGSSGAGSAAVSTNIHAERSSALRVFAPVSHRHEAEIAQWTGLDVAMTATGVPLVRGAQVVCHVRLRTAIDERELRARYRDQYADEPFVRIIAHRRGNHRMPDPKVLLGSNFCDIGFALAEDGRRAVLVAALDNLVKGAAGNAVQSLNVRMGWPDTLGLEFTGLHPL